MEMIACLVCPEYKSHLSDDELISHGLKHKIRACMVKPLAAIDDAHWPDGSV